MLEFLRRQSKPIMIAVTAIIIIAFVFWGDRSSKGGHHASAEDTALVALGHEYSYAEVQRIQRLYTIASMLRLPGVQNYFASELTGLQLLHRRQQDGMPLEFGGAPMDFVINLLVLRDALEKHGIYASDDEVKAAFRQLGAFQVNGQFDPERARNFESGLGSMGFRINDVYEIIRDSLGFQKLQKIVAGNVVGSAKLTEQLYASTYQTIKAASIPFALDTFKKTAQVKDEDIKKYFEENKENYKTAEKRAVTYVFFPKPETEGRDAATTVKARNEYGERVNNFALAVIGPKADFEALARKAVEDDKKRISDEEAEAKKAEDKKKEDEKKAAEKKQADAAKSPDVKKDGEPKPEDKKEPEKKADEKKEPAKKQLPVEFATVPAFSEDAPPEALKNGPALVSAVFENVQATHPISDPVETDKGYYIFKVTRVEDRKQQELKDVQEKVREVLLGQKAQEAMQKAANDAKKKLEEAIKGGKKFEDAAKEAGYTPQMLAEFSPSAPPSDLSNGREIAFEARNAPAGTFTKPLTTENGVILVHVLSKELRKREDSATNRSSMSGSLDSMTRNDLFRAWFDRRYTEAGIQSDILLRSAMASRS